MRSEIEELTLSECWALLRTAAFGRLAMIGGDAADDVDVFPVNHVVDQGSIVFRTAAGSKLRSVTARERVTYEADGVDLDLGTAWSVIAKGRPCVITSHDDVVASFDLEVVPWQAGPKPTFVRIVPEQVSGRRFRAALR